MFSRVIEWVPGRPLPIMVSLLLAWGLLASRWSDWISAKPTVLLLTLTSLMVVSTLSGNWPGGSVGLMVDAWSRSLLYYLIVVTVGTGLAGVATVMSGVAWGMAVVVVSLLLQTASGARLAFELGGTLSNPNDLAALLIVGLPFCAWYVLGSGRPLFLRVVMAAVSAFAFIMLLKTGSRMGLLTLLFVGVVLFFITHGRDRLLLVVLALAAGIAAAIFVPKVIQERYQTMVDKDADDSQGNADAMKALGSSQARWNLFVHSLVVTAHHPLLGVGPGNFSGENADITKRAGQRANWQVTHNSYTQVSSECGIPAALIFAWLVLYGVRTSNRLRQAMALHSELRSKMPMAFWLLVATAAYGFSAMFGAIAYGYLLPLLVAVVHSLKTATADVLAQPARSPAPTR